MIIRKTWIANSKQEDAEKGNELVTMLDRWEVGVQIIFTNPFLHYPGPIEITGERQRINQF